MHPKIKKIIDVANKRKKKDGLTNKQIAEKSGVSVNYVGRFLNYKIENPLLAKAHAICVAIGFNFIITIE